MKYSPSSEDSKLVRNVSVASIWAELVMLTELPIWANDIHFSISCLLSRTNPTGNWCEQVLKILNRLLSDWVVRFLKFSFQKPIRSNIIPELSPHEVFKLSDIRLFGVRRHWRWKGFRSQNLRCLNIELLVVLSMMSIMLALLLVF